MTLGTLIKLLETFPREAELTYDLGRVRVCKPALDSWRGRYECLAIGYTTLTHDEMFTVGELLDECKAAIGKIYTGYKGGDYTMTENTMIFVDNPGDYTDTKLTGIGSDGFAAVLITARHSDY